MKKLLLIPLLFLAGSIFSQAPIPGKIEAELYDAMQGVQTQATADSGGGINVGWIDSTDWMDYKVNVVAQGFYTVSFRLACTTPGAAFEMLSNGNLLCFINPPVTGDYQKFVTVSVSVGLFAGPQTIRLLSIASPPWNINWFSFAVAPQLNTILAGNFTQAIDSFANTLDSTLKRFRSTAAASTMIIDTLTTTSTDTYMLSAQGFNPVTGDAAGALRKINIKLFNGTYSVVWTADDHAWSGQGTEAKTTWSTAITKSGVVIQITTVANPTNWTYKRYSL